MYIQLNSIIFDFEIIIIFHFKFQHFVLSQKLYKSNDSSMKKHSVSTQYVAVGQMLARVPKNGGRPL